MADKLTKVLRTVQQGAALPDERQTVAQFLTRWLDEKLRRLRPRAWATYEQAVRLHLVPGIGKIALAKLTPAQLDAWFREHQQHGASARAIRYARTVLRAALNQARKWRVVSENVAELVEVPRHQAREIQPLSPEQARKLLESVKGHRLGGVVSIATALGLRLGEALGLRWTDVDFDAGTLSVKQALERSGGDSAARRPLIVERRELRKRIAAAPERSAERRELRARLQDLRVRWSTVRTTLKTTEPKSARSRRTIRMPAVIVAALKAHRTRQLEDRLAAGGAWQDSGFVFTSSIGTALEPRNVTREFHAILAGADLPSIRFHDLRHTAATLLLALGVGPRTIMETLGHSQISLTLNTYSHVLPALQADAAAKLDAVLTR
ncbi:MAG TPA: tyrosine-type recombinase/integrase [Vicinamibacterales bacterium]|nr:tyrosine-type recombinase/integrase [Vicinamibacterales bacterium]